MTGNSKPKRLLDPNRLSSKLTATSANEINTYVGMAHFAGTGPINKTCRDCQSWQWNQVRDRSGQPLGAVCLKAVINGVRSEKKVPHYARACNRFEQRG